MSKLNVPKLIKNEELPQKITQSEFNNLMENDSTMFVPEFSFDVGGLCLCCDIDNCCDGDYVYAYICGEGAEYIDYAIVKTDDFYFNTYGQYKKAVKDMSTQLTQRWKEWVKSLYLTK